MSKQYIIGAAIIVLVAGAFLWYVWQRPSTPVSQLGAEATTQSTTTLPTIATSTPTQPASTAPYTLSLVGGDVVKSWSFAGAYTGTPALEQKAQLEIARLKGLIGSKQFTNYDIYVSIANQYDLLGDGSQEFTYLEKALGIDSTTTGLAWANMGQLLSRVGAYKTARIAFEKAIIAQPSLQYHQAFLDFLKEHYSQDSAAIQKEEKIINGAPSGSSK